MMRILHLVLAPRLSGAEVLVKEVAIHQQQRGHSVCVASLLPEHEDFAALRAELERHWVMCRFPEHRPGFVGKLLNLLRVVRRFRVDVIFAHSTIPAFYVRALPVSVPIVYVMHSATNDFTRPLFRWVERLVSRRARAVIGVSQANVDDYVASVGRHPLMMVIPNGIDIARFSDTRVARSPMQPAQVVQIGRYTAVKNQLQTVRAFREVVTQMPATRLSFYGVIEDHAYYQSVIDLADRLGIADRVSVNGPRSDIPQLLSASDVFAMPSLSEGHSIAFMEALASGIPIVGSAIPAFEFAKGFTAVQLIDTDDTSAYARALTVALLQGRAQRPMDGLTLADTAERYVGLARKVMYRASV